MNNRILDFASGGHESRVTLWYGPYLIFAMSSRVVLRRLTFFSTWVWMQVHPLVPSKESVKDCSNGGEKQSCSCAQPLALQLPELWSHGAVQCG